MAGSQFACQTKSSSILKKLEKTTEKKNVLEPTQTWLNAWKTWVTERKLSLKLEEQEREHGVNSDNNMINWVIQNTPLEASKKKLKKPRAARVGRESIIQLIT